MTTVHATTATQKTVDGPSGKVCCCCCCCCGMILLKVSYQICGWSCHNKVIGLREGMS